MTLAAGNTLKLCVTGAAAAFAPLPACEAEIEHVPPAMNVMRVAVMVQMLGDVEA